MINSHSMEGVLLVSDMDRTLITDSFSVPKRNIDAIKRFISEGGHFTLATGRCASSATKYLNDVDVNAPSILSNGASIYDLRTKKILWNTPLPENCPELIKTALKEFPNTGVEIYTDENIYIINANIWTKKHIIDEGFDYKTATIDTAPKNWQKVLFADSNENLIEIDKFLQKIGHDGCDCVFSNEIYYEILPHNVSKGTVLKRLANFIGGIKTIVGIGDYYNDETLIEMADFGATVKSAPDDIKSKADFVTGECENGAVADLIEYLENNYKNINE